MERPRCGDQRQTAGGGEDKPPTPYPTQFLRSLEKSDLGQSLGLGWAANEKTDPHLWNGAARETYSGMPTFYPSQPTLAAPLPETQAPSPTWDLHPQCPKPEGVKPRQKVRAKVRRPQLCERETALGYMEMETGAKGNKLKAKKKEGAECRGKGNLRKKTRLWEE